MTEEKKPGTAPERAHAVLSASSSARWMHCTPSARAEERFPDPGSEFAREGTLAHAIAARKLKERLGLPVAGEMEEIAALERYYAPEMEEHTDSYADFVMQRLEEARHAARDARLCVETRLDFSDVVPEGFGTGDAVIVTDGLLEVIDLKYGKGVKVEAERNPQMMLYAYGALVEYDYAYRTARVRMTIYQPRLGHYSVWECTVPDLVNWIDNELAPLARVAWLGKGGRVAGSWCRFCRAAGECAELARRSLDICGLAGADELDVAELGRVLPQLPMVEAWVSAVKDRAQARAMGGERIPGFKLVEGRSLRVWNDQEGAFLALKANGVDPSLFWKSTPRTVADLEKTVGKKLFGAVAAPFVSRQPGKPALVPEDDRRPALSPGFDFEGMV